eukprot:CAMPEP_0178625176 /NCGR_PEP_ID=MMETSP0698-20121128/7738_1 /TAXON_ID=265572 /ORGANISM="Extubocellulus spinifer, Strain CCMP396" /LENGTH=600 /DNA_ID=CAMNT_0020264321 /DNA_START=27 /DNA_END=1829 /DNA_ORIENTATION=+
MKTPSTSCCRLAESAVTVAVVLFSVSAMVSVSAFQAPAKNSAGGDAITNNRIPITPSSNVGRRRSTRSSTTLYYKEPDDQDRELVHRALLEARLGGSNTGTKKNSDWKIHRALLEARLGGFDPKKGADWIHRALLEARLNRAASSSAAESSRGPVGDSAASYIVEDDLWPECEVAEAGGDDQSSDILAALKARREELKSESTLRRERWVSAKCQSSVRLATDDWVRRLDLKRWPTVALGSAKGSVLVACLERGEVVARVDDAHSPIGGNPNANSYLYGEFDGGGTTAVAIKGDSVISAGREGGAKAWRLDSDKGELVALGDVAGLGGKQVTALSIDAEGRLWAGVYDGTFEGSVYRYDLFDPAPLSQQTPLHIKLPSGVLNMAISDETALVACGTTGGTVELISMEKGLHIDSWKVNAVTNSDTHVRAVEIFQAGKASDEEEGSNKNWCVIAGCGNGSMRMRWLQTDGDTAVVDPDEPFDNTKLPLVVPPHNGMVVSLTGCRQNGLLVSGSQDGTLRVYDFCYDISAEDDDESSEQYATEYDVGSDDPLHVDIHPVILYQLAGYKVWLSSICVDDKGLRLVTDGADNTVVVHDYSAPVRE